MQRKITFTINEFYHIYNRGVEKRIIFTDKNDYHRFILLMNYCNNNVTVDMQKLKRIFENKIPFISSGNEEPLVEIGAWCLMPNHFHILLKERIDGGISKFMLKLTTGYSMYFNRKHKRVGALFQGTFGAEHVDTDNHLKYLFSYIHLNPVKLFQPDWKINGIINIKKTLEFLEEYDYSSFGDYLKPTETREWGSLLNKKSFPEYFLDGKTFTSEIFDWLEFNPNFVEGYPSQK